MDYVKLGRHGIKISRLSFGSWITFGNQLDLQKATECLRTAFDLGVNFFDNAEVYAGGKSEEVMGQAFKKLGLPRLQYLVSTKFYWGIQDGVNSRNTLNRKYLMQAIEGSLSRLQMDFVDLVYCHRPDPDTPIEETVWAMHDIVASGKALYWGTSEWSAAEIEQAFTICEAQGLRKPVVEQPQYNLFNRDRVETEFAPLYKNRGLGLTTFSPLASGILTGKYLDSIPAGTRLAQPSLGWLRDEATDPVKNKQVAAFTKLAATFECTPAQLAIAWCLRNPNASSVITGASSKEQVIENLKSLNVLHRLDSSAWSEVEKIFA